MVWRWILCVLAYTTLSFSYAEEPFRTFTAVNGQSFTARALSYEGQTFYLEGKDKKLYPVPYNQLSEVDQSYLRELSQVGKLPIGDPRNLVSKQPAASTKEQTEKTEESATMKDSIAEPIDGQRLKAQPKKKAKLRPGSFFSYQPVKLGQDPNLAVAAKAGGPPKAGEPIDFTNHVLPILEDRCLNCHNEPYDKNGRTIQPKAGLALNTYEMVMKGNLDNTVVTAGDVADSYLHEVLTLDEDDDMFMPPKGGPLTAEQIDIIKRWIEEGAKPKGSGGGAVVGAGISFHDHIFPILEDRCLDCHGEPYAKKGRTIHPKAGLALNTYEFVLKGNLDGPIVERGNHEESTLYVVMTLDPDDSELMPPKGEPLTEDEISLFKQWIDEGAKEYPSDIFDKPKEDKVAVALTSVADAKVPLVDLLGKRLSKPSKTQIEVASKTGALVTPLSVKHNMIRAEFSSGPNLIEDDAVRALSGIQNNISHLDLSRTKVTNSAIGNVSKMKHLTWLGLRNTGINDQAVKKIKNLQFLRCLNLSGTKVTDGAIKDLAQMKDLEELYLWNSEISEKGVESLRSALPKTKVVF
ncbi:hypothetical protein N9H22_02740 [Opitutales bacterium]|nr:hypothetical protein [Opitutales bacterium]